MPIWVSASCTTPFEDPPTPPGPHSILLTPIEPAADMCAVALIPDASATMTLVNGARVQAGLHVLRHADHLVVDGRTIWTSITATPDDVDYDPRVHGDPLYCFRTKARIEVGDRIVVCRGRPDIDCGMKFSAAAWSTGIACHRCRASPADPGWMPPAPRQSGSLEQLLHLATEA